jgi:ligand-binding SRPBCC domain-containing protein
LRLSGDTSLKVKFIKESLIKAPPERVFAFHLLPDALERLVPPWEKVRVIQKADISRIGSRAIIETTVFALFHVRWVAEHVLYDPPREFEDVQIAGPFKGWRHRHIVRPHAEEGAILRDEIEYELPLGVVAAVFAPFLIERRLEKLFNYRHEVTRRWCEEGE